MTHNHSLFRSLCTQRWTRACSLSPEAPSFWLAFQARPALCMHVFVKVQCSSLGSTLEDKCFSVFSTDWRWQWWRTSNSAVAAFIAKRPRVAYSCSYVLLIVLVLVDRFVSPNEKNAKKNPGLWKRTFFGVGWRRGSTAITWLPAKTTSTLFSCSGFRVKEWRSPQRRRANSTHSDIFLRINEPFKTKDINTSDHLYSE